MRRTFVDDFVERETITGDWFGTGQQLEDQGITLFLNFWIVYQANVSGGLAQDQATAGEYRIGADFDLERLAELDGAGVFLDVRGGWDDDLSAEIGSLMLVNGEFITDRPIVVAQLW